MKKKFLPLFFIILVVLSISFGLFYYYYLWPLRGTSREYKAFVLKQIVTKKNTEESSDSSSPFEDLGGSSARVNFEKNLAAKSDEELGLYWSNWAWRTHMVFASIKDVNSEEDLLTIKVSRPRNFQELFWKSRELTVSTSCPQNNTVKYGNSDFELLEDRIDIFEHALPNDLLFAYCLNDTCSEIGRECVLISR